MEQNNKAENDINASGQKTGESKLLFSNVSTNALLYNQWVQEIKEYEIFPDSEDVSNWCVTQDNVGELMNVMAINDVVTVDEMQQLVGAKQSYDSFIDNLLTFIVDQKKVSLQELYSWQFDTPASRVSKFLARFRKEIEQKQELMKQAGIGEGFINELDFAIKKINDRRLFEHDDVHVDRCHRHTSPGLPSLGQSGAGQEDKSRRGSARAQWMSFFSGLGSQAQIHRNLLLTKTQSTHLQMQYQSSSMSGIMDMPAFGRQSSMVTMEGVFEKLEKVEGDHMQNFETSQFSILDFMKVPDVRKHLVEIVTVKALKDFDLMEIVSQQELIEFLGKVCHTYDHKVQYHNDTHGADVMQQGYFLLTTCQLAEVLNLNKLDCLSFLIAAVCHDLGHDGYNNTYHVNAITSRAIDSNDGAVQEFFHAAELFRILSEDKYNFALNLSREEFVVFRKRAIGLILATDMANHASHLNSLNATISENQIEKGQNLHKLITGVGDGQAFKNQQFLMEQALHSCDVSQQTRSFEVAREWTYLLFDEFFCQGDLEREQNLPISFLCDRETVNVAASQPGFANFVVIPLFKALVEIIPNVQQCLDQIKANVAQWKAYEETEEDKKVYVKKEQTGQTDSDDGAGKTFVDNIVELTKPLLFGTQTQIPKDSSSEDGKEEEQKLEAANVAVGTM